MMYLKINLFYFEYLLASLIKFIYSKLVVYLLVSIKIFIIFWIVLIKGFSILKKVIVIYFLINYF